MTKIFLVLGTRPEIIKLGPLAATLKELALDFSIVHTGQHYDQNMSGRFLDDFNLHVTHQLDLGNQPRGQQIGDMTQQLSRLFADKKPAAVVVQGDTNTALAGALAANACTIPLVHIEAGLRSYDRRMPEEHNRVLIDHIADLLCAPTTHTQNLLEKESVKGKIVVTGNTELDAIEMLVPPLEQCQQIARSFGFEPYEFAVSTIHRPENTDDVQRLRAIIDGLSASAVPVLLAVHPRTRIAIKKAELEAVIEQSHIQLCDPLTVTAMWSLLKVCTLAISDSGGIQEDVSAFGTPLLVVRNSTERPEVLDNYARLVSATDHLDETIYSASIEAPFWRESLKNAISPYLAPSGQSPSHVIAQAIVKSFLGNSLQKKHGTVETLV